MSPLFNKLNLGTHRVLHVLGAPASFDSELQQLQGVTVHRTLSGHDSAHDGAHFVIAFAFQQATLDAFSHAIAKATAGDAVVWIAYPKGTSKNYRCEFNRDSGWAVLGDAGFETVRQVAIDDDWSGLRFRRAQFVKKMTREPKRALSVAGKSRVKRTAA
jgi:hypothetical protein